MYTIGTFKYIKELNPRMGTMTINVTDDAEMQFRDTVKKTKGSGKGVLGQAVTEALTQWAKQNQHKEAAERLLEIMNKGFPMGKILYHHRSELYERD